MISNPKTLCEQILNLAERIAIEMKAIKEKVTGVTDGSSPVGSATKDADGNVITDTYATKVDIVKGVVSVPLTDEVSSILTTEDGTPIDAHRTLPIIVNVENS